MGKGRLRISGALMRDVFCFPTNTDFHGGERFDEVEILVSHPDIPEVAEGADLPLLSPAFRQQPPVVFIAWNADTDGNQGAQEHAATTSASEAP